MVRRTTTELYDVTQGGYLVDALNQTYVKGDIIRRKELPEKVHKGVRRLMSTLALLHSCTRMDYGRIRS